MRNTTNHRRWITDRERQRVRSLSSQFQKTNRILSRDLSLKLKFIDDEKVPATMKRYPGWTKYPEIFINYQMFGELREAKTLVQLLGLNYHELSHYLFSPRNFKAELPTQKAREAYNILEDQRIESLFTAMYGPAGKYFTEMCVRFILSDESAWPVAFLYTHGRSYLPLEIREEFEARFVLSKVMRTKAKRLIEKYKTYSREDFSINSSKRWDVIETISKFAEILSRAVKQNGGDKPAEHCDDEQTGGQGATKQLEKSTIEKEQERREKEEETGEDQSGFWEEDDDDQEEEDTEGDSGGSPDEDGDGDEDGASEGPGEESGEEGDEEPEGSGSGEDQENGQDSDGEGSDSDSGDGEDGDGLPGDEEGSGDPESGEGSDDDGQVGGALDQSVEGGGPAGGSSSVGEFAWDADELREYLDEIIDAVTSDEDVQQEVQGITRAMNDLSNIDVIDFGEEESVDIEPTVGVNAALMKVTQHFRKLYAEVEPGWNYGSNVGRLNVGRFMNDPENYDEAFDQWDEGREQERGLEVFISQDISGSMSAMMGAASTAMWMIKRACDDVGAFTTVVGFHSLTVGLFDRKEKAKPNSIPVWTNLGGNTLPAQSMHLARRVLETSDMPNKLFVIITDGGWGMANKDDPSNSPVGLRWKELIESIPGTRVYIELGGRHQNPGAEKSFHIHKSIADPTEVVEIVEATITQMLTSRRR